MDNLHNRLKVELGRKNEKFGGKILQSAENIALRSLQILYIFVLRTERAKITTKMVNFLARNTSICKICKLHRTMSHQEYVATRLCSSTNLRILFLAVAKKFVLFALIEC